MSVLFSLLFTEGHGEEKGEGEREERNLGFRQNTQIMLRRQTQVGITMSHAVLRIMPHAVGPLGGFVRPGHCTRFELTECAPLPRNSVRVASEWAGQFYRLARSLFLIVALKQELNVKQAQVVRQNVNEPD